MKVCMSVISGIIGLVCGLIAMWIVGSIIDDPNVYVAVGIASFFGSFFGKMCNKLLNYPVGGGSPSSYAGNGFSLNIGVFKLLPRF